MHHGMHHVYDAAGKPARLRTKPPAPTVISRKTARSLAYMERHGLADFSGSNLVVDCHRANRKGETARGWQTPGVGV